VHEKLSAGPITPFTGTAHPLLVLFGERQTAGGTIREIEFRTLVRKGTRLRQIEPVITNLVSSSATEYAQFASSSFEAPAAAVAAMDHPMFREGAPIPPAHVAELERVLLSVHHETRQLADELAHTNAEIAAAKK
jgi:hypothetical protein